jgi:hypothetical protein
MEPTMGTLLLTFAVFSIVPLVLYFGQGGGVGPRWGMVPAGEERLGAGAYREQNVTRYEPGSAPLSVRMAALSCFYFGQMVVPGGFAALAGVVFVFEPPPVPLVWAVLEMSAPTGLCVASFLLSTGWNLLEGDPSAVTRTRRAVRWSVLHNLALLVGLGVAAAVDSSAPGACIAPCVYACLSLAQTLLMHRAAAAIEAHDRRAHAASPGEIAVSTSAPGFATPAPR